MEEKEEDKPSILKGVVVTSVVILIIIFLAYRTIRPFLRARRISVPEIIEENTTYSSVELYCE